MFAVGGAAAEGRAQERAQGDGVLFFHRWLVTPEPAIDYTLGTGPLQDADDWLLAAPLDSPSGVPGLAIADTFTEKAVPPPAGAGGSWTLLDLRTRASATLPGALLSGNVDFLGYGPGEPFAPDPNADDSPRQFRLGLEGAWDWLQGGAGLESATGGLAEVPDGSAWDRDGVHAWFGLRFGIFGVKTTLGEFRDNIRDDARRPTTRTLPADTVMELAIPSGPLLRFVYSHTAAEESGPRRAGLPRGHRSWETDSLTGELEYRSGARWDLAVRSAYTRSADADGWEDSSLIDTLSVSYRPLRGVAVTPSVSLTESTISGSIATSRTVSASLAVVASRLLDPFDVTVDTGYHRTRASGSADDPWTIHGLATVSATLRWPAPQTTVALEVRYLHHVDPGDAVGDSQEFSVLLRVGLAAF